MHAVDRTDRVALNKAMAPQAFYTWCAQLPAGCLVAMEACGGAHHVARRLRSLGLDARLIAGHLVTLYRMAGKRGKNDVNDAAAICEAASRRQMRFVPIKTVEQQGQLTVHRLREGLQQERTAMINRIRGILAEFGLMPSQNSTGGKVSLGRITKRGDDYLRTLLIQGAKSAVMSAGKRDDRISHWLRQLRERVVWQEAVGALANKNARILWAVLTRDTVFDPDHVPAIPAARSAAMTPAPA